MEIRNLNGYKISDEFKATIRKKSGVFFEVNVQEIMVYRLETGVPWWQLDDTETVASKFNLVYNQLRKIRQSQIWLDAKENFLELNFDKDIDEAKIAPPNSRGSRGKSDPATPPAKKIKRLGERIYDGLSEDGKALIMKGITDEHEPYNGYVENAIDEFSKSINQSVEDDKQRLEKERIKAFRDQAIEILRVMDIDFDEQTIDKVAALLDSWGKGNPENTDTGHAQDSSVLMQNTLSGAFEKSLIQDLCDTDDN